MHVSGGQGGRIFCIQLDDKGRGGIGPAGLRPSSRQEEFERIVGSDHSAAFFGRPPASTEFLFDPNGRSGSICLQFRLVLYFIQCVQLDLPMQDGRRPPSVADVWHRCPAGKRRPAAWPRS